MILFQGINVLSVNHLYCGTNESSPSSLSSSVYSQNLLLVSLSFYDLFFCFSFFFLLLIPFYSFLQCLLKGFTSGKSNGGFLIHTDMHDNIDGFVDLSLLRHNGIEINFLATKADKLHQGIVGALMRKLQKTYNYIKVLPLSQNAANFYEHFGFKIENDGDVWNIVWKRI